VSKAEGKYKEALEKYGGAQKLEFPNTAYFLPVIYSLTGIKVTDLDSAKQVMDFSRALLPPYIKNDCNLPYLGPILDAGMGAIFAVEIVEAIRYVEDPDFYQPEVEDPDVENGKIWLGAADDAIMRKRGVEFVDGTAPGFAAIVGAAPDSATAKQIAEEYQQKSIYVFMAANQNGTTFAEQLIEEGVQIGWNTRLVSFGPDISAAVYAVGFANRAGLSFGGIVPGDYKKMLAYQKDRIFAFVVALGDVNAEWAANAAGAINWGFPTIADTDIPEILPTGICTYEHIVSNVPHDEITQKSIEVRGLKVTISEIDIPLAYGPAFEGEWVRKDDLYLEPILERQIHHLINYAQYVMHIGQRDISWIRVSQNAVDKGFTLKDIGTILHAKLHQDFGAILDKVQVTLYTDKKDVDKLTKRARGEYKTRDERVENMTDESVETFYSCTLCQSFAPSHVCMISPERTGLCGAYNWMDCKASFEINPTGPNQPVEKGEVLDPVLGQFKGVNEFVFKASRQTIDHYNFYSIVNDPMTTCGCCEAIAAVLPGCNGVMTVHRDYSGMTPCGMKFSTLAGTIGGGLSSPGFVGHGKYNITQRKFILGDGGLLRMVWMPKSLKEEIKERLDKRAAEMGVPDLYDKIADETVGLDEDLVLAFLKEKDHPALKMDPIVG
jgi:acetyl-CoA synthase